MKPAAPSRAFWSSTIHCQDCKKPRPWFFEANSKRCIICQREKNREKMQKFRANRTNEEIQLEKQRDLARKQFLSPALRRCRDNYYKIRKRSPKSIPKWVTIESLLPIYEYAEAMNEENPEYRHVIEHQYPLLTDKTVCGLHTIDNLQILRFRRMNGRAFCPTVLR